MLFFLIFSACFVAIINVSSAANSLNNTNVSTAYCHIKEVDYYVTFNLCVDNKYYECSSDNNSSDNDVDVEDFLNINFYNTDNLMRLANCRYVSNNCQNFERFLMFNCISSGSGNDNTTARRLQIDDNSTIIIVDNETQTTTAAAISTTTLIETTSHIATTIHTETTQFAITSTGTSGTIGTASSNNCILVAQSSVVNGTINNGSVNLQCEIMINAVNLKSAELYAFIAVIVLIIIFFCLCPICCLYYYCRSRRSSGAYETSYSGNERKCAKTQHYSNTTASKNYEVGTSIYGKKKNTITYVTQEQEIEAQPMFNPSSDMYSHTEVHNDANAYKTNMNKGGCKNTDTRNEIVV